ncbi:MAG: uracil-DNA glycosylase family protein [Bacteroidota bacterium]
MQHRTFADPIPLPQFPSHRPGCTLCPLHKTARHVGIGLHRLPDSLAPLPSSPALLVVGQNPGYWENACGTPFVGKSGQALQSVYLDAAKLHPSVTIYVTNTARCFHGNGDNVPNPVYRACSPYLLNDIKHLLASHCSLTLLLLGGPAVTHTLKLLDPSQKKPTLKALLKRQGLQLPFPPPIPVPKRKPRKTPPIPPPATGSPSTETSPRSGMQEPTPGLEDGRGVLTIFGTYHPAFMLRDLNACHAIGGHMHLLAAHVHGTMPLPSRPDFRSYHDPVPPVHPQAQG